MSEGNHSKYKNGSGRDGFHVSPSESVPKNLPANNCSISCDLYLVPIDGATPIVGFILTFDDGSTHPFLGEFNIRATNT